MMTLGKGDGRPVVGLDLGRVVGGCSQQIIHDQLCAKSRLRRIDTDVEREFVGASINRESPNRCVRRNRGGTMDTRAWLQVNFDAGESTHAYCRLSRNGSRTSNRRT